MTTDRFIAVQWPLKAIQLCTTKRAKWTVFGMVMFCFAFSFHFIFTQTYICDPILKKCKCKQHAFGIEALASFILWGDFVVNSLIPILSLAIFNTLIIKAYNRSTGKRAELYHGNRKETEETRKEATEQNQLTRMLLLISIAFLITVAPHRIGRSINVIFPQKTAVGRAIVLAIRHFNYRCWFINNAINFYLYVCGGGERFRNDLKMLFRCKTL
jgi:hypothetical protein